MEVEGEVEVEGREGTVSFPLLPNDGNTTRLVDLLEEVHTGVTSNAHNRGVGLGNIMRPQQ